MFTPREALPHGKAAKIAIAKLLADLAERFTAPEVPYSTYIRIARREFNREART